eukprot:gnl/TRDRNA2_/TRDRNA2_200196_c0_seq1.p1 gnl/TRDRNA2_/TRDRNA2_200196_c0~~gnl/TRDRNA2_/TRDRNA2_200196_c0_seq1.p1  ORF type:complete len:216 (+),score=26.49 gnl/TRDRNA2_/TRDRNA2_200196_c0_seq1:58-705(+)
MGVPLPLADAFLALEYAVTAADDITQLADLCKRLELIILQSRERIIELSQFSVTARLLSGAEATIQHLLPDEPLGSLVEKIHHELQVPKEAMQLCLNDTVIEPLSASLHELGLCQGSVLNVVRQQPFSIAVATDERHNKSFEVLPGDLFSSLVDKVLLAFDIPKRKGEDVRWFHCVHGQRRRLQCFAAGHMKLSDLGLLEAPTIEIDISRHLWLF